MAKSSLQRSHRYWRRLLFLLLVIIPFVPEIVIYATAAIARLGGCTPDQEESCLIASRPANDVIAVWLQATAGFVTAHAERLVWLGAIYGAIALWLVACYAALLAAWTSATSRLLLGFALALVFAVLPYFGPLLAIADLVNEKCQPNEGGIGACEVFGGYVGELEHSPAHDAVQLGWFSFIGAPLALLIYALYAIVVIVSTARSAKRPAASG